MTRREQDREDILAEATALVERVELQIAGAAESIVVGFRQSGAAAIYFGQDVAYQFNAGGKLRRAFVDNRLYKAERGRLAALRRERTAEEVQLVRRDLNAQEAAAFLAQMNARIAALRDELQADRATVLRQISPSGLAATRVEDWLRKFPDRIEIANSPRADS
jgi:hypothetical protein